MEMKKDFKGLCPNCLFFLTCSRRISHASANPTSINLLSTADILVQEVSQPYVKNQLTYPLSLSCCISWLFQLVCRSDDWEYYTEA